MLHCSMTHTLARTREYQYFCFLLSHLSQPSQQHTKNLIINTINSTSKWQTTHFAVTLLSHCCHTILPTPPLHPIEQNLLSHYYHITVTPLSPKPFLFPKSTSSSKESAHSLEKLPYFPEKVPYFPENVPYFPENVPHFPKKVPRFPKKWDIIEENAHLRCSALWQMWQKKTQKPWYIRARA